MSHPQRTGANPKDTANATASGVLGLTGERMSKVDTAWLRMDCEQQLMMIVGCGRSSLGLLTTLCPARTRVLLKYDRFRQRVVQDAAGANWKWKMSLDIGCHVTLEQLPKHAKGHEQEALQQRVGELAITTAGPCMAVVGNCL